MSQLELIEKEKRNDKEDLFKIHFYLEGDWWRAYEWSAYLCHFYPNNLSEKDFLVPIHRHLKGSKNGIICVGLKSSSFNKYFPNISINDETLMISDSHMIFNVQTWANESININNYSDFLCKWKEEIPYKESPKNKTLKQFNSNISFYSLLYEILGYPIESNSLIENTIFLTKLKEKIFNIQFYKLGINSEATCQSSD